MQPKESQSWATTLGLQLNQAMLETQLYTADQINKHMQFFDNHVAVWLGPEPQSQQIGRKPAYPSALTSDHTPLEVSYSWKRATHANVAVRFVVDIIPQDGDLRPAASLLAGMQAISTLGSLHATGTVLGFHGLWSTVATHLRNFDRTIHTNESTCAHCCPSTTFVGFDLSPTSASSQAKLYWLLPSCQRVPTLVAELDALVATCIAEHHFRTLAGFPASWARMRDYLERESSTLRPRMLSIDATKYPFPRLKLYNRVHFDINRPFDDIESHLTLGGIISKPVRFLAQCRTLWDTLMKHYQQNPNSSYQDYCMVEYEIRPLALIQDGMADVSIDSKLYLFCDRTPEHDAFVVRALLGQFEGPSSFLERPDIKSRFSSKSASIKEIGLAARGDDTEIAAYISPCVFSENP